MLLADRPPPQLHLRGRQQRRPHFLVRTTRPDSRFATDHHRSATCGAHSTGRLGSISMRSARRSAAANRLVVQRRRNSAVSRFARRTAANATLLAADAQRPALIGQRPAASAQRPSFVAVAVLGHYTLSADGSQLTVAPVGRADDGNVYTTEKKTRAHYSSKAAAGEKSGAVSGGRNGHNQQLFDNLCSPRTLARKPPSLGPKCFAII